MYKIVNAECLADKIYLMDVEAPRVAKACQPGEFVIVKMDETGERIPLTVAGTDRTAGTVRIIFQIVGATTMLLGKKKEGEYIADFVGPLGRPTEIEGLHHVAVVGGGVGCAIALPIAEALHEAGCEVSSVIGFRSEELVILEKEFRAASARTVLMSDDGSAGRQGVVTLPLKEWLESGERFDRIFAIGPLIMMKFVVETARPFGIPVTVSMNPIMIDGTGMCGGCRLTVDGKMRFACVDGPDFDGYGVDFDEAISRGNMYRDFEATAREKVCNLYGKEENGNG